MTLVDIDIEDTHKDFEKNQRQDDHQYRSLNHYCSQYLLNRISKLATPSIEIGSEQLIIELDWTDTLQMLIDYANRNVFRSFRLHLKTD